MRGPSDVTLPAVAGRFLHLHLSTLSVSSSLLPAFLSWLIGPSLCCSSFVCPSLQLLSSPCSFSVVVTPSLRCFLPPGASFVLVLPFGGLLFNSERKLCRPQARLTRSCSLRSALFRPRSQRTRRTPRVNVEFDGRSRLVCSREDMAELRREMRLCLLESPWKHILQAHSFMVGHHQSCMLSHYLSLLRSNLRGSRIPSS